MVKQLSYHRQWLKEHYVVEAVVPENKINEYCNKISHNMSKGRYHEPKIIDGKVAFEGEEWIPAEPVKIVYVHRTPAYQKQIDSRKKKTLMTILCKNIRTGKIKDKKIG